MFEAETSSNFVIHFPDMFGDYQITKIIGCGSTSVMAKAINVITKKKFAVKIMSLTDIRHIGIEDKINKEIKILSQINHPNIAQVEEVLHISNFSDEFDDELIMIVMEYCPNGDLHELLNSDEKLSNERKFKIMMEILSALNYLHGKGISHGDIKPENIVFDKHNQAKLIDFGFSKDEEIAGEKDKNGTLIYAAPEILYEGSFEPMKADIWSFGVLLCVVFTRSFPYKFYTGDDEEIANVVYQGKTHVPRSLDDNLKRILSKCFSFKAENRPSIKKIYLQLKFLAERECSIKYDAKNTSNSKTNRYGSFVGY